MELLAYYVEIKILIQQWWPVIALNVHEKMSSKRKSLHEFLSSSYFLVASSLASSTLYWQLKWAMVHIGVVDEYKYLMVAHKSPTY
jgi:hypothetical protein